MASILIIDDDATNGQLYSYKLQTLGHTVTQAIDGEQAQNLLTKPYDLIILDLMIPKSDGVSLLQEIRNGSINTKTKVLVFTNLMEEAAKKQCLDLGALDVWYKVDYTPQTFINKLVTLMPTTSFPT